MSVINIAASYSGSAQLLTDGAFTNNGGFGEDCTVVGSFGGNDIRSVFQFSLAALSGATVTAVSIRLWEVSHTGINYSAFSTWPFNTNGQGNPQGAFSTAWSQAARANQYLTGGTAYRSGDGTYVSFVLPAQGITDLNSALAGGNFTLCQGLDSGSSFGNNYAALGSHANGTAGHRPELVVTYTAGGGGTVSAGRRSLLGVGT